MVLFILNVRSGLAKLPPVASAPPMGGKKPVKSKGKVLTVTVNRHEAALPAASRATQLTLVMPTGNSEPEGGVQVTVTSEQVSVAEGVG
jgi:hypothetical protein